MNKPFTAYALTAEDDGATGRSIVDGAHRRQRRARSCPRRAKKIGKSLEADVHLTVPAEDAFLANVDGKELADLLIVSQVEVTVGDGAEGLRRGSRRHEVPALLEALHSRRTPRVSAPAAPR